MMGKERGFHKRHRVLKGKYPNKSGKCYFKEVERRDYFKHKSITNGIDVTEK